MPRRLFVSELVNDKEILARRLEEVRAQNKNLRNKCEAQEAKISACDRTLELCREQELTIKALRDAIHLIKSHGERIKNEA